MQDIITVSVVNYRAAWGDKQANLSKMEGYARAAAAQGAQLVLFPEMALTGFDDQGEVPWTEKMQVKCAEPVPGPSTLRMSALAQELGIWLIFGMPERAGDKVYNAAAVAAPDGKLFTHRKAHVAAPETNWAARGEGATVFDTPWGPVGLAICYEVYRYPELIRCARGRGARLFLNPTAASPAAEPAQHIRLALEAHTVFSHIFTASANLAGKDLYNDFYGGSCIIGPSPNQQPVCYHAGFPFDHPDAKRVGLYTATLDLTGVEDVVCMFRDNPAYGSPDFRPGLYAKLYGELAERSQ